MGKDICKHGNDFDHLIDCARTVEQHHVIQHALGLPHRRGRHCTNGSDEVQHAAKAATIYMLQREQTDLRLGLFG